ncbi:uroporphyrinogen-III synthase [Phyllobacterium salinisoli]|uniref:Uroporphyrinogen-III synthase n=1 Tax=Phyllobacterium salinisoli TaxID=1899321 RepID=A0A368K182_9HYPH|nr:uroporphyrinogen-III synthase [Phyllobacterium salinisoli]RCS22425.1 uroporphyrinogen-III synthase [Phyllobacterium salinisoli]
MAGAVRVLVTRPEPGASHTARRLEELGFLPIVLPLSETVAIGTETLSGQYDAVAITSVNAVRHADPAMIERLAYLPAYAVGHKTAGAAKSAGFAEVTAAGGDGEALATKLSSVLRPGAHVLYLAGRVRRPDFETKARAAGLELTVCETYDTAAIGHRDIGPRLGDVSIDVALIYSAFAAKALVDLVERREIADNSVNFWNKTRFLCLSSRISESLPEQWKARALISERPDEQSLLNLLASL